ncbi:MAG: ATP-binding cassette domain-containing protein [Actinobacteria bacterium]|nr:ATP-binding cassette domain-containing protein [Actinomycetota bacterium]
MAMISLQDVAITRGRRLVIDGFSAALEAGTITAIVGPNGCGKSSLLAAIAGDIPLTRGEISLAGRDISEISLSQQAELRSVVLQNRNYWLSYTVREVIAMGQNRDAQQRMDAIVEVLDMTTFADQSVTTLSGGQAQRVEIARALVRDSEIYLLDEPLAAQDSQSKSRVISILQKLRDQGKTILVIAHSDKQSLSWCDHVIDTLA